MATSGKGTGIVGYNVQTAVDAQHHLIVAHDVTNVGHDRDQLSNMAGQAQAATGVEAPDGLADRGYFKQRTTEARVARQGYPCHRRRGAPDQPAAAILARTSPRPE